MKKQEIALPIPQCNSMGLALTRIGVGLFFALFGLMKFMGALKSDPQLFGMVEGIFGTGGMMLTVLVWGLVAAELGGGIMVILGKLVPKIMYQLSLVSFIIITVIGTVFMHMGNVPQMLWHGMLMLILVGLIMSEPKCACGITGSKK